MRTDMTHRAYSPELKRFVYGNFHYNEKRKAVISRFPPNGKNLLPKQWVIDEKTLGIFTGAYDRKGITIFEGDEVEYREKRLNCENQLVDRFIKGFVYYDLERLCFRILVTESDIFIDGAKVGFYDPEEWKIVGNIHKL